MTACTYRVTSFGALLALILLCACGGNNAAELKLAPAGRPPSAEQLSQALNAELARLGIDAQRTPAAAPGAGNAVFDLAAVILDPDGAGPLPPTGVQLAWTERCLGDYDQNGEVNAADLVPLGQHFAKTVSYREPDEAGGLAYWPAGNPEDDGDGTPPLPDSGAANWRLARVDGNGDGELGIGDLTPIAVHWHERLDGYRIYRRAADEAEFQLLPNPDDAAAALTIPRRAAFPEGADYADPLRPVLYRFTDAVTDFGPYEYYVVPFDTASGQEGMRSASAAAQLNQQPVAALKCTPAAGEAPLDVLLSAAESADPDGSIVKYEWDYDGDGTWDFDSGNLPQAVHTYELGGEVTASVRVTDDAGATATAQTTVSIKAPPLAQLTADPLEGGSPLTVDFDASASTDSDGQITAFQWDFDGDGSWDFDSGTDAQVQHVYPMGGVYHACVRALDNDGLDSAPAEVVLRIDNPPIARFSASQTAIPVDTMVVLAAEGSYDPDGEITLCEMNPDGGSITYTADEPVHWDYTYHKAGEYDARLTVTDDSGLTDTTTVHISVYGPPAAGLTAMPPYGNAPLTVSFTGGGGANIIFWEWDWEGDGVWDYSSRESTAQHTYAAGGVFHPRVQATSDHALSTVASTTVNVNAPPVAVLLATPVEGNEPLLVSFDASGSYDTDGTVREYWFNANESYQLGQQDEPGWQYLYNIGNDYTAVLRVVDDDGAWSEAVRVPINVWRLPKIMLTATPDSGRQPLEVVLDASGSEAVDGQIVSFEFDLDGDGNYDYGPSLDSIVATTYTGVGSFYPKVRVTDSNGCWRQQGRYVQTYGWEMTDWYDLMYESGGDRAVFIAGGNPAVAYTAFLTNEDPPGPTAFLLRALDAQGDDWANPLAIDDNIGRMWCTSIVSTVAGVPLVATSAIIPKDGAPRLTIVRFSAAQDAAGSAWNPPVQLDELSGLAGLDLGALQVINGAPAVVYCVDTGQSFEVRYVRALDAQGLQWPEPRTVLDSNMPISYASLIDAGGRPAIACVAADADWQMNVVWLRASDPDGAFWDAPSTILGPFDHALELSPLLAVEGNPALAIADGDSRVWFMRATAVDGSAWSEPQQVYQGSGFCTKCPVLQLVGGLPAVLFGEQLDRMDWQLTVYYCKAQDALGSNWPAPETIAPYAVWTTGNLPYSLLDVNGRAFVWIWETGLQHVWLLKE